MFKDDEERDQVILTLFVLKNWNTECRLQHLSETITPELYNKVIDFDRQVHKVARTVESILYQHSHDILHDYDINFSNEVELTYEYASGELSPCIAVPMSVITAEDTIEAVREFAVVYRKKREEELEQKRAKRLEEIEEADRAEYERLKKKYEKEDVEE